MNTQEDIKRQAIRDLLDAQRLGGVTWNTTAKKKRTAKDRAKKNDYNAILRITDALRRDIPDPVEYGEVAEVISSYGVAENVSDNAYYQRLRRFTNALRDARMVGEDLDYCLAKGTITAPMSHLIVKAAIYAMRDKNSVTDTRLNMENIF